ncbi:hypothetical protein G7061_08040 [Erysipelothrix sp. HDW6B]|uniref:hypothetical protein n=1 Tax=Erysipelothrix sp. HDW6B TaxID=2714929 RepID=UPI00140A9E47|nr:hypothetical protein [Erysipelothrix sp. HDW6B]QIK86558.1 hypothetical protein G7061_08040 [Erysipelothrix sp. HDW6B]
MVKNIIRNYRDSIIIAFDISFFYIVLSSVKYDDSAAVVLMLILRAGFIILRNSALHNNQDSDTSRKPFVTAFAIALDQVLFYFILSTVFSFEDMKIIFLMLLRACLDILLFSDGTTKYKDFRGNVWFRIIVLIFLDSLFFFVVLYQIYDGNVLPVLGLLMLREVTTTLVIYCKLN